MIDATPEAMRLINALYNTGLEVCHQKSPITQASAARVLDDAGVREIPKIARLFGDDENSGVVDRGNNGFQVSRYAMSELRSCLATLTGTRKVNDE